MQFVEYKNDGSEIVHDLPCNWIICPQCRGKGTSSLYLGAITQSDREPGGDWEDSNAFDDYMGGSYDRTCETCHGSGKIEAVNRKAMSPDLLKAYDADREEEMEYQSMVAAERRAGC